jgi:hypothetical protein
MLRPILDYLAAEAQITPTVLTFPPAVIESMEAYNQYGKHGLSDDQKEDEPDQADWWKSDHAASLNAESSANPGARANPHGHNEDPLKTFFANQNGRSQAQRRTYDGRR